MHFHMHKDNRYTFVFSMKVRLNFNLKYLIFIIMHLYL